MTKEQLQFLNDLFYGNIPVQKHLTPCTAMKDDILNNNITLINSKNRKQTNVFPLPTLHLHILNLFKQVQSQWTILHTFDMFSPENDESLIISEVNSWFKKLSRKNI